VIIYVKIISTNLIGACIVTCLQYKGLVGLQENYMALPKNNEEKMPKFMTRSIA
jgi:hypothetical protein